MTMSYRLLCCILFFYFASCQRSARLHRALTRETAAHCELTLAESGCGSWQHDYSALHAKILSGKFHRWLQKAALLKNVPLAITPRPSLQACSKLGLTGIAAVSGLPFAKTVSKPCCQYHTWHAHVRRSAGSHSGSFLHPIAMLLHATVLVSVLHQLARHQTAWEFTGTSLRSIMKWLAHTYSHSTVPTCFVPGFCPQIHKDLHRLQLDGCCLAQHTLSACFHVNQL